MADIETLDGVYTNVEEDTNAQMSVVPLATRMRMAADDDQLQRPKYMQFDEALLTTYDEIMSRQTKRQAEALAESASSTISDSEDWLKRDIIRDTVENYIVNLLNKPEKLILSIGNYLTTEDKWKVGMPGSIAAGVALDITDKISGGRITTIGQKWANWANESINDYIDRNMASQRPGDIETWTAKTTGGVLSAAEYMGTGVVWSPLANISMGVDILGQATKNDLDRYIAETGDTALTDYRADWKDVAVNFLNVGAQLVIEDKLGFGRVLKLKTAGADEFLAGFAQEFFQGITEDVAESAKGNQEWASVWNNMISNIKDGVVGALLQGFTGLAAHHHYTSLAENGMKDFFVKNGMDEKAAAQKAHDMRIRMEKEIAPLLVKTDKDLYDLVMQKGATWGTTYDVAYNALKATDTTGMTEEQMQNRATELANQVATTVIQSVIKDGTDISEAQIIFNPADNTIYVNDKKSLNIKQALQEIQELDEKPATKKEVKQAIAEEKKAEQKKVADTTKPVSAADPKAPFNKTKEKSPVFKQMQKGIDDGSIKLNKTEQTRYAMLLRDKLNNKPTTNRQMDNFAEKMVQKYVPATQTGAPAIAQPTTEQVVRKPNKYDTGAKKASKMSESLKQKAPAELAEDMAREMEGEYNQRMTKDAVTDAVNFALSSEENMQTAIDAVMSMKEIDGIRPFEMYAGLLLIATKYNHPLLFEQLRQSPIHKGLATQAGQDISALQFTTESGMINIMKVVNSLEDKMAQKEEKNKGAIKQATKELVNELNNIQYTDDEVTNALEKLEC